MGSYHKQQRLTNSEWRKCHGTRVESLIKGVYVDYNKFASLS